METMKLLDGSVWQKETLLNNMYDDDFYFNTLSTDKVLSKSSINDLVPPKSPKAWYYGTDKKKDDAALRAGTLFHLALLEPEKFEKVRFSKFKTRMAKAWKEEQATMSEPLYTATEKAFNEKLVSEFTVNKRAMMKLSDATFEVPLIGYIEDIPFRGKADIITPEGVLIDLKTCANLQDFPKNSYDFGYDIQCYIYSTLMGATEFEFLVIAKKTYDIGFFKVDKSFIEQGREKLMRALDVYKSIFWGKEPEEIRETLYEMSYSNTLYSRDKYNKQ